MANTITKLVDVFIKIISIRQFLRIRCVFVVSLWRDNSKISNDQAL